MSEELCALLAVVAVAKIGIDHEDVSNSSRIIEISNRLAAAGSPVVLGKLEETSLRTTPLDRAITLARSLRQDSDATIDSS